jgi:hypothetical protein
MAIPLLDENGLLPPGLYLAETSEIERRFGKSSQQRKALFRRFQNFVELAQYCGALRILVNGSFVTAKPEPNDVDVVIWLGKNFHELLLKKDMRALLLQKMFYKRQPEEAFFVSDQEGWDKWVTFFSIFKQNPELQKGLIEVELQ